MISIGESDISPVHKTWSDGCFSHGRDREVPLSRDIARRSRLFGRDAPQVVATAVEPGALLPIEGGLPRPFAEGVVLRRRICEVAANLAHPCTIDPSEGADRFGRVTKTKARK